MAVVTFSKPVGFPIAPLREMLTKYLPLYRWQCGEDDDGGAKQMGVFQPSGLIQGRSDASVIFTEYRAQLGRFPDAPAHEWYLELFAPTTELQPIAERITAVICAIVMIADEEGAHCQLVTGGAWLPPAAMPGILRAISNGATLADAVAHAGPGVRPAAPPPSERHSEARKVDARTPGAHKQGMPMLMLLADRMLQPDWPALAKFAQALDEEGDWTLVPNGLAGRGTRVMVNRSPDPAPDVVWDTCLPHSFWYKDDPGALRRHRATATIGSMLDPAASPYETVRQVAKVMTMIAGVMARLPGSVAVINATTQTIYTAEMVRDMLGILGRDELPVALWTRTLLFEYVDGDVSIATVGLAPLLGHEVEVWNAPLTIKEAGDQQSGVIRYLLDRGPVIGHGDTMGKTPGERAMRCFLGPSRAPREHPVKALFVEFEAPEATAPRPDLPEPPTAPMSASSEAVLRDFAATVGRNDITGMGDIIRSMLRDNEASKIAERAIDGDPLPRGFEESERLIAQLKNGADGKSAELLARMQAKLRDPGVKSDGEMAVLMQEWIRHEQSTGALPPQDDAGNTAIILLNRGVAVPQDMFEQLRLAFPERRWTLSDSARGLNEPRTLTGVGGRGPLSARIVASQQRWPEPDAPAHLGHVAVHIDTDDGADAVYLAAVVCACLVIAQDKTAHCRLAPGTSWIGYDALVDQMVAVKHLRRPPAPQPMSPAAAPGFGRRVGGFGRKGL